MHINTNLHFNKIQYICGVANRTGGKNSAGSAYNGKKDTYYK